MEKMHTVVEKNGYRAACGGAAYIRVNAIDDQITEFVFGFARGAVSDREAEIEYSFPAVDIAGIWYPDCGTDRRLKADWSPAVETMMSISAPVMCFYNNKGENIHTAALSEVKRRVSSFCGIREEDGKIICRFSITVPGDFFLNEYRISIWRSDKKEPFWNSLQKTRRFWESGKDYFAMEAPEAAREPVYSFWYSYHQNVTEKIIEEESRRAKELGYSTVIVDDGWQTEDNKRGYAFCGDWKPSKVKFKDFAAHVGRVKKTGLRYMLWFPVPYMGVEAENFTRFKDKLLTFDETSRAGILDIRYPEVREYLKGIYIRAVRDWGVDGLKLDFIDEFYLRDDSPAYGEGMDFADVQEALGELLSVTTEELKKLRTDIMIEFRQRYVGPEIRRYGNILRVVDCPGSAVANRLGTIDLRLLSGDTAVHSDMLMWHTDETVENAALQMVSCLFSTVQLSVRLDEISDEQKQMIRFWTEFQKSHRILLQKTQIEPEQPHDLYPSVRVRNHAGAEELEAAYAGNQYVDMRNRENTFFYVHACGECSVILEADRNRGRRCVIKNCMGEVISEFGIAAGEIRRVWMPEAGILCSKADEEEVKNR